MFEIHGGWRFGTLFKRIDFKQSRQRARTSTKKMRPNIVSEVRAISDLTCFFSYSICLCILLSSAVTASLENPSFHCNALFGCREKCENYKEIWVMGLPNVLLLEWKTLSGGILQSKLCTEWQVDLFAFEFAYLNNFRIYFTWVIWKNIKWDC